MTISPDTGRIPQIDFTDRLVISMRHAGVNNIQLGEYLGVHPNSVSNWTRGLAKPRKGMVRSIAVFCGVPYTWLLSGDDETPPPTGGGARGAAYQNRTGDLFITSASMQRIAALQRIAA